MRSQITSAELLRAVRAGPELLRDGGRLAVLGKSAAPFRVEQIIRDASKVPTWAPIHLCSCAVGRLEGVHGGVYVEGRTRWLANTWALSADMPPEWQPRTYVADGFTLTMNYGGMGTAHHLTPAATADEC